MIGYTEELGSQEFVPEDRRGNAFQMGLVSSVAISPLHSFDFNLQYEKVYSSDFINNSWWHINADFGTYALHPDYLLILGAYYNRLLKETGEYSFSVLPGISVETAENFLIVLNMSKVLKGKWTDNTLGFNLALTIILD